MCGCFNYESRTSSWAHLSKSKHSVISFSPNLIAGLKRYRGNSALCLLGVCVQHNPYVLLINWHPITPSSPPSLSPPLSEIMNNKCRCCTSDTHQHQAECQMAARAARLTAAGLHEACRWLQASSECSSQTFSTCQRAMEKKCWRDVKSLKEILTNARI